MVNPSDLLDSRYRLERLLGTGGMSEVWLAEDMRLGRWVAVKVLRDLSTDLELATAIASEARLVAGLQHPNIVTVFDTGQHDGRHYLVMEYVHGYSIRQLLESQGRLTEAEAIRYGSQVAEALSYAHGKGVIHCDIKPENILIGDQGVAKVADFGVADTVSRTLTPQQAREFMGTVAYLAPEVLQGGAPSPASDIYSLGLLLYEMVAGRLPFAGANAAVTATQRLATPAPLLRSFAMGASVELEAVLARALALSPSDRYASGRVLANALQRVPRRPGAIPQAVLAPPGRPPRPLSAPGRHHTSRVRNRAAERTGARLAPWIALLLGGVFALAVGGVAAYVVSNRDDGRSPSPTPTPTSVAPTPTREATSVPTVTPTNEATLTPIPTRTATPPSTATRPPGTPSPSPAASATPSPSPRPPQP